MSFEDYPQLTIVIHEMELKETPREVLGVMTGALIAIGELIGSRADGKKLATELLNETFEIIERKGIRLE